MTSFIALDKATHSASELDSVTLFWAFYGQEIGIPNIQDNATHVSPTYQISSIVTVTEPENLLMAFLVGYNFTPNFFVSKTYLSKCSNSVTATGIAPLLAFDSSMVVLAISCLECLIRYSNIHFPNWYFFWSSAEMFSLLIIGLTIKNLGITGTLWLWILFTCLPTFLPRSQ